MYSGPCQVVTLETNCHTSTTHAAQQQPAASTAIQIPCNVQRSGTPVRPLRMQGSDTHRRCFSGYSRHVWAAQLPKQGRHEQLVWVNRWYTPKDLRALAPVQKHKFLAQPRLCLSSLPPHWVPLSEAPLKSFSRATEETDVYASASSSRCEQWSTLRQMLPSKGHSVRHSPPKWGTGFATPPSWSQRTPRRSPHINSPMTNYADDMHLTNRLFRLH